MCWCCHKGMRWLIHVLVILSGMSIPPQLAANKRMGEEVRSPMLAVAMALILGGVALLGLNATGVQGDRGDLTGATRVPWWVWLAGLMVAYSITIQIISAKQEGAGPMLAFVVAGQLTVALVLDHFGALGMKQDPVRWWKIAGLLVMATGAGVMQIKGK